jgi:hypothetical protein
LPDAAKVVVWGLVFWGGEILTSSALEKSALAMVAAQAGLAEWAAGRLAIPWSDRRGSASTWRSVGRRAALGASLGLACATTVVAASLAARAATVHAGDFAFASLLVGALVAVLGAVRDELLLRGVVVRATRLLPIPATLVACGLAAAAARFGIEGRVTGALVPEALKGAALGALWLRDRGAWMACAANAAWTWALGPVVQGDLIDLRSAPGFGETAVTTMVLVAAAVAAGLQVLRSPRVTP